MTVMDDEQRRELVDRLAEMLFEHDPMCGETDCRYTAEKIAPEVEALFAAFAQSNAAETGEGVAALRWLANERTVDEWMALGDTSRWANATPERRIEMMGERKRAHDAAVLNARAALGLSAPLEEEKA